MSAGFLGATRKPKAGAKRHENQDPRERLRDPLASVLCRWLGLWVPLAAACALLLVSGPARAQFTGTVPAPEERLSADTGATTRGAAMGTGSAASALGTSAVVYNPANLPLARVYHVESLFGYLPGDNAFSLGAAVADSVSNRVAAGIATRRVFGGGVRPYDGWDMRLSLGLPISQAIGIGVSGRYFKFSPSNQSTTFRTRKGFTLDVAVRVTPTDGLHIAALGYNLINRHTSLSPTLLGGSLSYSLSDRFSFGGDFLVDITTFDQTEYLAGGGVELLLGDSVPVRLGYRHDTGRGAGQMTGSIGYVDQSFGIDLSLQQPVTGPDTGSQLLVSVRYQVQ